MASEIIIDPAEYTEVGKDNGTEEFSITIGAEFTELSWVTKDSKDILADAVKTEEAKNINLLCG